MSSLAVDTAIPAGNGIVERIDGDDLWLRQDRRDTGEWWFWWNVRIRGAGGRTIRLHFTDGDVLTSRGPAVSLDGGATWTWGETCERIPPAGFALAVPPGTSDLRLALAMPYTGADLDRFLAHHPAIERTTLCRSRRDRDVPLLRVGRLDGQARHRVLITARHHACETLASWAVEGLLASASADDALGRRLRERVELLCVPLVDSDGVADGDQGKARQPHDHNRDYGAPSIYPEIAAIRTRTGEWADGRLHLTLDLHCPWIRSAWNEHIYAVEPADRRVAARLARFCATLESVRSGPLPYAASGTIAHGTAWNTGSGPPRSSSGWMAMQPGVALAATFEIPYAEVRPAAQILDDGASPGIAVTPAGARAFGRDLAHAIDRWLAEDPEVPR